ncbi:hypothetical protein [Nocardia ignorata]|uniref:Uncharacterized protein n=1 Tax=Nocardia ignorata TaxID=145285 RepID=A0A4R6P3C5_NOCIG|nr:hypothetical protein [Nocardia ignorata]TDP29801.1 hypothetical protein DFR75_11269 [Nocardia ignorata]
MIVMKPGDKVMVPYSSQQRAATVAYVSGDTVGVLFDFAEGDSIPGLYRRSEIEGQLT